MGEAQILPPAEPSPWEANCPSSHGDGLQPPPARKAGTSDWQPGPPHVRSTEPSNVSEAGGLQLASTGGNGISSDLPYAVTVRPI